MLFRGSSLSSSHGHDRYPLPRRGPSTNSTRLWEDYASARDVQAKLVAAIELLPAPELRQLGIVITGTGDHVFVTASGNKMYSVAVAV